MVALVKTTVKVIEPPREGGVTVWDMVFGFIVCNGLQALPHPFDVISL